MKTEMGMHPLFVMVDNFSWTETGRRNFENISEAFNADVISLSLNRRAARKMLRAALIEFGSPTWYWDRAVYTYPLVMAARMGIPLVIYGENISHEYGGPDESETPSAKQQWKNGVADERDIATWRKYGVTIGDLEGIRAPSGLELYGIDSVYLSYYVPWDGLWNLAIADSYGFRDLGDEWAREGYIEQYDQIDAIGYLVHCWLKYPKYGHARTTDVASSWVRAGKMTREDAAEYVREHDRRLDPRALADFCMFTKMTEREFWEAVEPFWNRDIFEKVGGEWRMKPECRI
jgi:hypothetical protein